MKRRLPKASAASEIARDIVAIYFQSWNQTPAARASALNKALEHVSIETRIKPEPGARPPFVAKHGAEGDERFRMFMHDLSKCWPLGKYEVEKEAVVKVLKKWREKG